MWSVPLPAGSQAAPTALPPPARLPQHHTRSVFSICFGTLQPATGAADGAGPLQPALQGMLTTSMDRAAAGWRLPRPVPQPDAWKAAKVHCPAGNSSLGVKYFSEILGLPHIHCCQLLYPKLCMCTLSFSR